MTAIALHSLATTPRSPNSSWMDRYQHMHGFNLEFPT